MKPLLKRITMPELNLGDIAHAHGARFQIVEAIVYRQEADHKARHGDMGPTMWAKAEWLDGDIVPGYFGPSLSWTFQGNRGATVLIEVK